MKKRIIKICLFCLLLLGIGILYGLFVMDTGLGIPCIFYTITGWKCPGCGVTHMCIALMHGDFKSALHYNPMVFFLSPLLLFILGDYLLRYIRTECWIIKKWQSIMLYFMIGAFLVFAVIRNIYGF